jgi:hypothetical protein
MLFYGSARVPTFDLGLAVRRHAQARVAVAPFDALVSLPAPSAGRSFRCRPR